MYLKTSILLLGASITASYAADCYIDEPRSDSDPSAENITKAYTQNEAISGICNSGFGSNPLFNTWSYARLTTTIRRVSNKPLEYCSDALNNILSQCIINGNSWGGYWTLEDEQYTIDNSVYPNNPLAPQDAGGPPDFYSGPANNNANSAPPLKGFPSTSQSASPESLSNSASSSGTKGSPPEPAQTVVTQTVNGEALTGTFTPTTLSQFSKLSTTTTISTTTTDRDGDLIVIPIVIGAGGLAWWIFGGLWPGALPPPQTVPTPVGGPGGGKPDNPDQPSPQPSITTTSVSSTASSSSSSSSSAAACSLRPLGPPEPDPFKGFQKPLRNHESSSALVPSSLTTAIPSTSKPDVPPAQTVTYNCAICVLPYGSLNPNCTPIPGCVPTSSTPPPSEPTPAGPSPQQQCHERCKDGMGSPDWQWCMVSCGCYFAATGC